MQFIPKVLLKKLYTLGSLKREPEGISFAIKNRLATARIVKVEKITVDGRAVPLENILTLTAATGKITADKISPDFPLTFDLGHSYRFYLQGEFEEKQGLTLTFHIHTQPFGRLEFQVEDEVQSTVPAETHEKIPRDAQQDYTDAIIRERYAFLTRVSGVEPKHINQYSFDPQVVQHNCENFIGAAQVPLGLAGPLHINGEHAKGDFIIPLATTEGSLVASFNRGMKLINACGGVTCTVMQDGMQRAPMFVLPQAREARHFLHWIESHRVAIAKVAEQTSSRLRLLDIEGYTLSKVAFLRFVCTTGDAAGQNMVSKAVFEVCQWIINEYPDTIDHFYMESNLAADKKHAYINLLRGRGKKVTAEITLKKELVYQHLGATVEQIHHLGSLGNLGAFLGGASNNSLHSANALAALFIALGQDVANIAECATAAMYSEITPEGDLYGSITLPSLIVATYGGGTGLPTQKECLEIVGCFGEGKVNKLAEIVAGVVAAGEISLAGAIASLDWVSGHEKYGRNR